MMQSGPEEFAEYGKSLRNIENHCGIERITDEQVENHCRIEKIIGVRRGITGGSRGGNGVKGK
jgi:hypothetical protein